jgi:hypothetical protein
MILATDLNALEGFMNPFMEAVDGGMSLRAKLQAFADAHQIPV